MHSKQNWKLRHAEPRLVENLAQALNVSQTLARILIHRNFDSLDSAQKFLNVGLDSLHDPFLMKDMDLAVKRIVAAIKTSQKICIYGDYDVDGIVSTSLLVRFFKEVGVVVDNYIPHRIVEGYALNADSMDEMKKRGVKLIITVDNGISSHAAVDRAKELGIDVIVTDHHQQANSLPKAFAIINPHRQGDAYPFKDLAGAGVAFKLMMALRRTLKDEGLLKNPSVPNLKQYLDLVALATVCDVVPLVGENRYFVKEGLHCIKHTRNLGLRALIEVSDLRGRAPSVTDFGYRLGPRLNACGRLEGADLGVELLTTSDESLAKKIAAELNSLNQDRQAVEKAIVESVFERIEKTIDLKNQLGLVVYDPSWHEGVVGIVASRVVERFKRPVFVLSKSERGLVKGSGRSVSKVHLVHAIAQCGEFLEKFGGHEMAAGLSLKEENLPAFVSAFDLAVKRQMNFDDLKSVTLVDDSLEPKQINDQLMKELAQLEPYGMGNQRPAFVSPDLIIRSKRVVGEKHLKMQVGDEKNTFDAIAFNKAELLDQVGGTARFVFGLEMNTFRDVVSIQMVVKEIVS